MLFTAMNHGLACSIEFVWLRWRLWGWPSYGRSGGGDSLGCLSQTVTATGTDNLLTEDMELIRWGSYHGPV